MRRSPDWRGYQQVPRNPTVPLEPGKEYGWLTVVKQSAGDSRYTVFRCRCGERVIRMTSDVRESVQLGREPRCKERRACDARLVAEQERRTG